MRTLLTLLILLSPLFAQEQEEKETSKAEVAEIRDLLTQLKSGDAKERDAAIEKLRKLDVGKVFELLVEAEKAVELDFGAMPPMRVMVASKPGGSEVISGTVDDTTYTIKGEGKGRYQLTYTKKGQEPVTDEGTWQELQKKYDFLKGAFAFNVMNGGSTHFAFDPPPMSFRMADADLVGIFVRPAPEELRYHLALPTGAGLVVYRVAPGSFAEKIGLKQYDVIVRLDDELIDSGKQLKGLKKSKGVLGIIRRAKPLSIDLARIGQAEKSEDPEEPRREK